MAHDVFISYASEDKTTADAVCARLESRRIRCWIAPRDVLPSMDYGQALVEAIKQSRLVVLVFSARSNDSPHVKREVERAVANGIPILPFRIEDVAPSSSLEYFIAGSHWLDALTPPLERHLERLAETVELLLSRAGVPPVISRESEAPTKEPTTVSPVLVGLDTSIRGLLRSGLATLRLMGRLLRYGAAAVARHPRPYAIAAAGICGVIVVAVLAAPMLWGGGGNGASSEQAGAVPPASTPTATPAINNTPKAAATPMAAQDSDTIRLVIPSINVDTSVAMEVVSSNGEMPNPRDGEVIWYDFSKVPGYGGHPCAGGNTVLSGNVAFGENPVLQDLGKLSLGAEVDLGLEDGTECKFSVQSNNLVDKGSTSWNETVSETAKESLTIISANDFKSQKLVVSAVRVN